MESPSNTHNTASNAPSKAATAASRPAWAAVDFSEPKPPSPYANNSKKPSHAKPYSRALSRGAIGELSGRSKDGRFLAHFERELVAHVGGSPSICQKVLIRRAARILLRLEAFDTKLDGGNFTDTDARVVNQLSNQLRLSLRELGIKGARTARTTTLADIAGRHSTPAKPEGPPLTKAAPPEFAP
jgi:hypothetical protein